MLCVDRADVTKQRRRWNKERKRETCASAGWRRMGGNGGKRKKNSKKRTKASRLDLNPFTRVRILGITYSVSISNSVLYKQETLLMMQVIRTPSVVPLFVVILLGALVDPVILSHRYHAQVDSF